MEENNENNKENCLLLPVAEDQKIPPLEKIISLAKKIRLRIHLAGFISTTEVGTLISQTIKLTKILDEVSSYLKGKVARVSAKVYCSPFSKKINKVIEQENVVLIATPNASDGSYQLKNLAKNVMILQMANDDNKSEAHDILLMHKVQKQHIKTVSEISKLFGDRLFVAQQLNSQTMEDLANSFGYPLPAGLDRQANSSEINEWLLKHHAGLVALDKAEVKKGAKKVMDVLKNGKTPVLLY